MAHKPTLEQLLTQVNRAAVLADKHHAATNKLKKMLRVYYDEGDIDDDKAEAFMTNDTYIDIADYGDGKMTMEEIERIAKEAESGKANY
jgi:hypothetical protein